MKRLVPLSLFILLFSPAIALCQQSGNGAISGTVTDPSGAVVPKAQVTVTATQTGIQNKVTTNEQGLFSVPSLPPGNYSVSIQASGFKTYVAKFPLLADQAYAIKAQLQLGEATQNVTVEATGAQVNTVSPVLSQVLEQQRIVSLPLNGRNTADLALQVPGVGRVGMAAWGSMRTARPAFVARGRSPARRHAPGSGLASSVVEAGSVRMKLVPPRQSYPPFPAQLPGLRAEGLYVALLSTCSCPIGVTKCQDMARE